MCMTVLVCQVCMGLEARGQFLVSLFASHFIFGDKVLVNVTLTVSARLTGQ